MVATILSPRSILVMENTRAVTRWVPNLKEKKSTSHSWHLFESALKKKKAKSRVRNHSHRNSTCRLLLFVCLLRTILQSPESVVTSGKTNGRPAKVVTIPASKGRKGEGDNGNAQGNHVHAKARGKTIFLGFFSAK